MNLKTFNITYKIMALQVLRIECPSDFVGGAVKIVTSGAFEIGYDIFRLYDRASCFIEMAPSWRIGAGCSEKGDLFIISAFIV